MPPSSSDDRAQPSATDLVLLLREELKQQHRTQQAGRVEDLAAKWQGKISDEGVLDLIYQEIVLREEAGEQPTLDEYEQRFPHLKTALQRQFALHEMLRESLSEGAENVFAAATVTALETTPLAPPQALQPGMKVGQYLLEKELGRGGMGIVYRARDERLHRPVALKLLLSQEHSSPDSLGRFHVEAAILAQLQHPNIVQIFEIADHEGQPFFAMEFVPGRTLQAKLRENPLPAQEAARMVQVLAEAIHSAHERGIIHRDLKPSNVLLTGEQIPKISDFGLARQGQSDMTTTGMILGTPSYMAPEQALGQLERIGPATDVYALGAILFELLIGRAPFRGATVPTTLHQVLHDDPPSPRRLQPTVPRDLETICLKCLQKDPARRFASAKALADDLSRFLRGEPIAARPVSRAEMIAKWARREPKVAGLIAAVLVIVTVGFLTVFYLWQAERLARRDGEKRLYYSSIAQASSELNDRDDDKVPWARRALADCPEYLRGWEWRHLNYCCQQNDPRLRESTKIDMPGAVSSLATHPGQLAIVVGGAEGDIVIVQPDGKRGEPILAHPESSVNWLAFAPEGHEFFSGGQDTLIHGWKLADGEKTTTFSDHQGPISCLAVHPQEPWIASTAFSGPDSGKIFVWQRGTGKRIHTLENHASRVTGLAFRADGKMLASSSHDKTITLWDCRTGEVVRVLTEHNHPISAVVFSPDGRLLASSAGRASSENPEQDAVFIWDAESGAVVHRLQGHSRRAVALAFSTDNRRLASAGWDHRTKIWDVLTGQDLLTLKGHDDLITSIGFNADQALFTGSLDRTVRIWRAK